MLPPRVFDPNFHKLLGLLALIDKEVGAVVLDFKSVDYWIPAAVVAVTAMVTKWMEESRSVKLINYQNCGAFRYLKNIEFFAKLGLELPRTSTPLNDRFTSVEVHEVPTSCDTSYDQGAIVRRSAECLCGTSDPYDDTLLFAQYALGEMMGNARQHSGGVAFVSAQFVKGPDHARIGVADAGIGILESFRQNKPPHYFSGMTDEEALESAMKPWISSKSHLTHGPYGESGNKGLGLAMVLEMLQSTNGELFVASGNSYRRYQGRQPPEIGQLAGGNSIHGTFISIRFARDQVDNFKKILIDTQKTMDLTPDPKATNLFL